MALRCLDLLLLDDDEVVLIDTGGGCDTRWWWWKSSDDVEETTVALDSGGSEEEEPNSSCSRSPEGSIRSSISMVNMPSSILGLDSGEDMKSGGVDDLLVPAGDFFASALS